jgi:putative phosphoesterase
MRIGLLSDTHGFIDEKILNYFSECDEIWHAGDFGSIEVVKDLSAFRRLRGVFGNIDDLDVRSRYPEECIFKVSGIKVFITHIGGYPPKYTLPIRYKLDEIKPGLFICGHSHIPKIINDPDRGLLHINPGAAGRQGFHRMRSIVRFSIVSGKIENLQLIELGKRA